MNILSPTRHERLNEAAGIVLLLAGLFVTLSLLSYNYQDASWNTVTGAAKPHNLTGIAGAHVADFCLQVFGFSAYAIPVLMLLLAWKWVRLMTPFINIYAVFFLIGGAIRSAWRHYKERGHLYRAYGNALIAAGAILPGIGGSMAKAGMVEALYVGECIGLILIWAGDRVCSMELVEGVAPSQMPAAPPELAR